jgi:hypothetical protein
MIGLAVVALLAVALAVAVLSSRPGGGPVGNARSRVDGSTGRDGSPEIPSASDLLDAPPMSSRWVVGCGS